MTFQETDDSLHFTEKQPREFAQIHVENCTKVQDAKEQILLNWTTTVTLFDTNIGYHNLSYQIFRAPSWKQTCFQEIYFFERNCTGELLDVIYYLVVLKREVRALRKPRKLYTFVKGVDIDSKQSININILIAKWLESKVWCCKSKSGKSSLNMLYLQILRFCQIRVTS